MPVKTRLTFEDWKRRVNEEVSRLVGLSADDLADYPYRDEYDSGSRPQSVAKRAIRADQGGMDF